MLPYKHTAGTADTTVEIPDGYSAIKRYSCIADSMGGTVTITPKGGSAQDAITVPSNQPWSDEFTTDPHDLDSGIELPKGSTIAFAGMASWVVRFV